jgi:hypothetical protein
VIADVLNDFSGVEEKILGLADAFEQSEYDWRPGEGVRSGAEVFMHVTTINFAFPLFAGHEAPASTGLTLETLPTSAPALESSSQVKAEILPQLQGSFDHIRAAIESTSASDLERPITVFGSPGTPRLLWIAQVGHLHEHLGQLIAYARANGVVPPWSAVEVP